MSWSLWQWALLSWSQDTAIFALNWLMQSTLLILVGLATARLLARQGSAVQFVVYCTTLTAVLACPLLTWALSLTGMTHWSIALPVPRVARPDSRLAVVQHDMAADSALPAKTRPRKQTAASARSQLPTEPVVNEGPTLTRSSNTESDAAISAVPSLTPAVVSPSQKEVATVEVSPSATSIPWMSVVAAAGCLIWLTLSAWMLTRFITAWFRLAGIRRQAIPAETTTIQICQDLSRKMGIAAPAVMHTPFLPSPCLAGLIDPVVLLPETGVTMPIHDVLIHELAHLRRWDALWNLLRKLATGLFWFQPLLWVLSRRIEMSAEEVCDDFVVEFGGDRAEYAHRLVDVAEFSAVSIGTAGVAMVSFRSMLAQRVARIMDTSRSLSTKTSRRLVTIILLFGIAGTSIIGFLGAAPTPAAGKISARPSAAFSLTNDKQKPAPITAGESSFDSTAVMEETQVAAVTGNRREPQNTGQRRGALPGMISSPVALSGHRRWQMFSKNPGSMAENVCWSPDGRLLAIANGPIVRIFDFQAETPEFKLVLAGHDEAVNAVRFNAQGTQLATASHDGTVRIWDTAGREQFQYQGHEDSVKDVSWHPDGIRLASAGVDGAVRIWSTDGATIAVLRDHEAPVNAVAWNPNGKLLASGCENRMIRFWNDEGAPGPVIEAHVGPVKSLAWKSDGSQLASCDYGIESTDNAVEDIAHVKIWNTDGKLVNSMLINQPLSHVAWSPDGRQIAAGTWRSVKIWTIGNRQVVSRFLPNLNGVLPIAWRPTGEFIAVGPEIVNPLGVPQRLIPVRNISLISAGLSPDGTTLAVGRGDVTIDLISSQGEQVFHSGALATGSFNLVTSICWSPDGNSFIPGLRYVSSVRQFNASGNQVGKPIALPGDTRSVAWSRDGRLIAACGDQQIVSLVDLKTSKAVPLGRHNHGITQVRFTAGEQQVCSAGFDGCIRFWSLEGKPLKVLETIQAPIDSLAVASVGRLVVSGHQDNTIRFWNDDSDVPLIVNGHAGHVEVLEFNPAGTLLASGSRDHSIKIWKRDGTLVSVLQGHSGAVFGIQWTPDGSGIYSCAADGVVRCWNVSTGITEWQTLLGEAGGYVTLDSQGGLKQGDERILESEYVIFAEDHERRLARASWSEIRSALRTDLSARVD